MHQLGVVGNPIAHSLSPLIWSEFAKNTGVQLQYDKIFAEIDQFESVVSSFFSNGGLALNITAPFKARAFEFANRHNHHSIICKTANLLINKSGFIIADNTDGIGLVTDLKLKGASLQNKNILIIGNGSVIHSVLSSIEQEKPRRIDMLMRNVENIKPFECRSGLIDLYQDNITYDIVINTTPNNSENKLFTQIKQLSDNAYAYDMIYTAQETLFLQAMKNTNPSVISANGIGMLIQQAKFAFQLLFDIEPKSDYIYPLLQEKFHG